MDYTLPKQPITESQVISEEIQHDRAGVSIPANVEFYEIGTLLITADGLEYQKIATGEEPNAVLCERVYSEGIAQVIEAKVLLTGAVRESKLIGFEEAMRFPLIKNKILLK